MYFDALTLAAVVDELRSTILNGRIQRVLLPSPLSIGLEVYAQRQRYQVLASAHPQFARIHLVQDKPSRGVEQATPLLLLLRKYTLGGRIVAIEQPPLERVLFLSIVKEARNSNPLVKNPDLISEIDAVSPDMQETRQARDTAPPLLEQWSADDDLDETVQCELVIEPMDRRSNIILVDENNLIMESIKRVTPRMSHRVILPRQPYEVPPRQDKRDPRTATAAGIQSLRETGESDLVRALVQSYQGVSPQVAREIVYRVLARTQVDLKEPLPWADLATSMCDLFQAAWEPVLVFSDEKPQAYAPYRLTHIGGALPQPAISVALETFYGAREGLTAHQQRRSAVLQQLAVTRERLQHQLDQITTELQHLDTLDRLRWEGEMILSFLHTITAGQTELEVDGQRIQLDPSRTPLECAQARFREYSRARTGRESLQERQQTTQFQLEGLEQLAALVAIADERTQIDQIALEAEEQGYISPLNGSTAGQTSQKKRRRIARSKPLHIVSSDGFDIFVGRSAMQNAEVTFQIGRPEDQWLHVRTIPGAHVIVRSGGQDVPERTLLEAAGLAAYFSQARDERLVDVDLSRRSRVRKIAGAPPGLVTYRAERTLRVVPLPPERRKSEAESQNVQRERSDQ